MLVLRGIAAFIAYSMLQNEVSHSCTVVKLRATGSVWRAVFGASEQRMSVGSIFFAIWGVLHRFFVALLLDILAIKFAFFRDISLQACILGVGVTLMISVRPQTCRAHADA